MTFPEFFGSYQSMLLSVIDLKISSSFLREILIKLNVGGVGINRHLAASLRIGRVTVNWYVAAKLHVGRVTINWRFTASDGVS
jgi:hypothetical protein